MIVVLVVPNSTMLRSMSPNARHMAMLMPPLGVVSLATYLNQNGHEAVVIDAVRDNLSPAQCVQKIADCTPNLIGFSALTHNFFHVYETANCVRQTCPGVPVVFGNIHAEVSRQKILSQKWADFVVVGEGEKPLCTLADRLEQGTPTTDIPGVAFSTPDGWVDASPGEMIEDLDTISFPDWNLIDIQWYLNKFLPIANQASLPVVASRGCAYNCKFCSQDKQLRRVRHRSNRSIIKEMKWAKANLGVSLFAILDATFPWSIEQGHKFCDAILQDGLEKEIGWMCETRVDLVTPELLQKMAQAGCRQILYGFESGDPVILKNMNKGQKVEQSIAAARATHKAKIPFHGFFLIGFQGETTRSVLRTIRFALKLDPTTAKFHMAMPMPGSAFYKEVKDQLAIDMEDPEQTKGFDNWNNWALAAGRPIYTPEGMSEKSLIALFWFAHIVFYGRPWKMYNLIQNGYMSVGTLFAGVKVLLENIRRHLIPEK